MKKNIFFCIFVFLFELPLCFSQSRFSSIESKNYLYFSDIAKPLVLELGLSTGDISNTEAENLLLTVYPNLNAISRTKHLCYNDISFLLMQIFNIQGGLFYSILPNKHYSFRELQYLEVIPSDIDPMKKISGKKAIELFIKVSNL